MNLKEALQTQAIEEHLEGGKELRFSDPDGTGASLAIYQGRYGKYILEGVKEADGAAGAKNIDEVFRLCLQYGNLDQWELTE